MSEPFSAETFPKAIVHFDGDCFFASVEQALNYTLRGKPIIVGAERGAATALSIEAKRLGLSRGMSLKEIRRKCPQIIVVNSDYTAYTLFARRMYNIARRFTPHVEEYSIDECFADITGLDVAYNMSYEDIARAIQHALHSALGITFGVGLGPSKVLAKTASKIRKPAGFTSIPVCEAHEYLKDLTVGSIWGIGPSMAFELNKLGVTTALDFASRSRDWLYAHNISKPYRQIWSELRGVSVHGVHAQGNQDIGSIQKTRTFTPPSVDRAFLYSQLAKNVEKACARARAHGVLARHVSFFLKTQEFLYGRDECDLAVATSDPREVLRELAPRFNKLFLKGVPYRATGVSLSNLVTERSATPDLFGESAKVIEQEQVFMAVDTLNKRYGSGTVVLAASMKALLHREPERRKKNATRPTRITMPPYLHKKTLDLPFLGKTY